MLSVRFMESFSVFLLLFGHLSGSAGDRWASDKSPSSQTLQGSGRLQVGAYSPDVFPNDRRGARPLGKRYHIRLLPELHEHLSPMRHKAAKKMEVGMAEDLRGAGYTVTGRH